MNKFISAIIVIAILVSCKSKTQEHGHEHGLEPLAYTLYSDKSELFVEFKPLVVGNVSKFTTHLTVLGPQFLPLIQGSVTVSLILNDKGIKQTSAAPAVPGIYRLSLQPVLAGTGKLIFDIVTSTFIDQIIIDNVKVYPDEKTAMDDQPEESGSGDITYLKEQAWKVEFANTSVIKQPFNDVIKTSGQIISAPGDEILVTAKAHGVVIFSGNKTIVGSAVASGTNLFTVEGGDFAQGNLDATFKEAKANYEKAKASWQRASELLKDKIVSQKEFEQSKADYENAQAIYNSFAKNYSAKGQAVQAGISGYIKNIFVSEGQMVEAGTPLATISKNKRLLLQANVSQKYFNRLANISTANFKTTESDSVYSTTQLNGKVVSYGKSAAVNAPFLPIVFEIDNSGTIIPGSVAEVYLKSSSIPSALVIPVTSLIEEQGNFYVYVQMEGESFQKREVKTGAGDGVNIQLLSGVLEGERVVTKGAYQIKLTQASGTMPAHGHEH